MRQFDWGARADRPALEQDRIATVPNAISAVRLATLPLFVWLLFAGHLGLAFGVLVAIAITDFVDGYVARRFDQVSRLGKVLDPLIDRVLIVTAGVSLWLVGFLPGWLLLGLVLRDVLVVAGTLVVFRGRMPTIPVSPIGKAATAALLVGVPGFLLGHMDWAGAEVFAVAAWAFCLAGLVAYWVAGLGYARAALAAPEHRHSP